MFDAKTSSHIDNEAMTKHLHNMVLGVWRNVPIYLLCVWGNADKSMLLAARLCKCADSDEQS